MVNACKDGMGKYRTKELYGLRCFSHLPVQKLGPQASDQLSPRAVAMVWCELFPPSAYQAYQLTGVDSSLTVDSTEGLGLVTVKQ